VSCDLTSPQITCCNQRLHFLTEAQRNTQFLKCTRGAGTSWRGGGRLRTSPLVALPS